MELCAELGAIGADAVLITKAERSTRSRSTLETKPSPLGPTTTGMNFGTVTDRIEIVALRTRAADGT